jgi:hypothetical protein
MRKLFLVITMAFILPLFPFSAEKPDREFKISQGPVSDLKDEKHNQRYENLPKEDQDKLEQRRRYEFQQEADKLNPENDESINKHRAFDVKVQVLSFVFISVALVLKICFMGPVTTSDLEVPASAA